MIKKNGIIILLLCLTISAFSQLKLGIKGGSSLTNMVSEYKGEPYYYSSAKTGYHIGFAIYSPINKNKQFEIETGLYIESKGFDIDHELTIVERPYYTIFSRPNYPEGEIRSNVNYLTLPAIVKTDFNSFYINTGFYISNALSAKSKIKKGELRDFYEENGSDIEKELEIGEIPEDGAVIYPYDYGLILGIGYSFDLFSLCLNYDYGLLNVSADKNYTLKNRAFKLSIIYRM